MTILNEVVSVPAAVDMSDENFTRHMSLRHKDSIGGLHSLWTINPAMTALWRSFHDRLHAVGIHHTHTHAEAEQDNAA